MVVPMIKHRELFRFRSRVWLAACVFAVFAALNAGRVYADLTITPTFTANFVADFGANAVAAENSWIAAANTYTRTFNDPIHINITVDAVTGTSVFGQSNTFLTSVPYSTLQGAVVADAKSADDFTSIGAGGSVTAADPVSGTHTWWVTTAQAKALGLIVDNLNNDGSTTFGAGNPFTFSGPIAAGTYDFQGVALHEISEVMGRLGISGGTIGSFANSYSLIDEFAYTGAGTRNLKSGAGVNFSIDNGTTLLKLYNDTTSNHLDTRDWAPSSQGGTGAPDAFNQFSGSGVVNPLSPVDVREMDVIGYDLTPVPEPSRPIALLGLSLMGLTVLGFLRLRRFVTA